jgi:hypothetical protein
VRTRPYSPAQIQIRRPRSARRRALDATGVTNDHFQHHASLHLEARAARDPVGTLEFVDGVPSSETIKNVYDHLDFVHGLNAYLDGFAGASTFAIKKGF